MAVIKLSNVRIAFPNLFVPKAVSGEGEPRFSAAFVIQPGSANAKILADAQELVAKGKWGAKAGGVLAELKSKGRTCYKEAPLSKDGEVYDGFEGMHSLNATNAARPAVIDRDTSPLTQSDGKPYGGCYVDVSIDLWAQDNAWGKRINGKLRWVQFRNDGESFGGGAPVSQDEFSSIADGVEADDLV